MAVHYPEKMRLRLPRGMPAALALAAGQHHTTPAEWTRRALLRSLEADGVCIRDGAPLRSTKQEVANDLTDTKTLAHLLKWDSVHGRFDGEIGHDEENIIVRGHKIKVLKERDPGNLPWSKLGVDVVLESTGFFTARDKAELHISKGGAKKVLISAPAKNPDATLCVGINDGIYDSKKHSIVSNASCTTCTRTSATGRFRTSVRATSDISRRERMPSPDVPARMLVPTSTTGRATLPPLSTVMPRSRSSLGTPTMASGFCATMRPMSWPRRSRSSIPTPR